MIEALLISFCFGGLFGFIVGFIIGNKEDDTFGVSNNSMDL